MNKQKIQTKAYLEIIPKYMLYQILIHVGFIDQRNVAHLNKYFNDRVLDPTFWRMNILSKFGQIPNTFPSKNIPRWYYGLYKNINTNFLGKTNLRSFSLSDTHEAGIDENGTLYVKTRYLIKVPCLVVKSVFCAADGIYFITDKKELYVIGYNPFGQSSDYNPMYITDQVTRVHPAWCQLLIEKGFQVWDMSPGKTDPVFLSGRDWRARAPGTCYYINMNNRLCDVTGSSTQVLAQDVKSFDYNRKLIFWITLGDKLYVRNYESDKTKCLAHNIKKVVCVSKKIYVLTQSGRLSSLPSSSFEFIENVSWSCEASDVVDFYANSRQVVTVTVP